jgi:cbb3-type cytochrome oxidase subunit 3
MKKLSIFIIIFFILVLSVSFGATNRKIFNENQNNLNLKYTMSIQHSEAVITFYIPSTISYYRWTKYNRLRFDRDVFNLILKNHLYNTDKNINIIVRTDFFPFKRKIVYSKKYNFEHQRHEK